MSDITLQHLNKMYHIQGLIVTKIYGSQDNIKPIRSNWTLYGHGIVDKSCPMQFGILIGCNFHSELFKLNIFLLLSV